MVDLNIAHTRLHNQRLVGTPCATPDEVVRRLCAVQSQDYGGAKWAVAQRTAGATNADLDRLFDAGTILRTHVLRPTWHFVMPADIRWMLALTAPRVRAAMASYDRKLELDDALFARSNALLAGALRGGNHLTRPELARVLAAGGIAASGQRLGHLAMRAELDAVICSGPLRGKQFTYALLDERAPDAITLARDEALAELTRRYFTSHGPAMAHDFAWWSGLSVTDARAGIEMVTPSLMHENVGGKMYWFSAPATTATASAGTPIIHLLPNYDEHLVAYKDHRASFDAAILAEQDADINALMGHIVVLNGNVIGGWRRTVKGKAIIIETGLLVALGDAERAALESAAEAYGRFMGMAVTLA